MRRDPGNEERYAWEVEVRDPYPWESRAIFHRPSYPNWPGHDSATFPLVEDFEVVPVARPPLGVEMRWQRSSADLLMVFPWYHVEDLSPPLDRDHPPVGAPGDPWLHADQGWFYLAVEEEGEVVVMNGDDVSNLTDRFRVPATVFRAAWAAAIDTLLALSTRRVRLGHVAHADPSRSLVG